MVGLTRLCNLSRGSAWASATQILKVWSQNDLGCGCEGYAQTCRNPSFSSSRCLLGKLLRRLASWSNSFICISGLLGRCPSVGGTWVSCWCTKTFPSLHVPHEANPDWLWLSLVGRRESLWCRRVTLEPNISTMLEKLHCRFLPSKANVTYFY